jgi:ATP-dependent DNA ligase
VELLQPMLSAVPSRVEAKLKVDGWWAQQKLDGVRLMIHCDEGKIIPVNRNGTVVGLPRSLQEPFSTFTSGYFVFDGEFVDGTFWLFDLPLAGQAVRTEHPYEHRLSVLEQFHERWDPGDSVKLVPTARTTTEKLALQALLRGRHAEGMILKNVNGKYVSGQRSSDSLKFKFWESCEVIITEIGREGKDNAVMTMIDPDVGPVEVGTVSTIGKGFVGVGMVAEVKYLYAVDPAKPSLYQPTILRVRDDKDMSECVIGQIKFTSKRVVPLDETGLQHAS